VTGSVLVVEHEPDASLGRFRGWLTQAGLAVTVVRPALGDAVPRDLAGVDGLIVLGGFPAAWEDDVAPWLPATRDLLGCAVRTHVPTLGLCLGGQLLAMALGGTVARGHAGWEVGVTTVTPTREAGSDPLAAHVPADGLPAAQWHLDAVTVLPPGATLLVTGSTYPHQLFRVGDLAWGTQFHPEVTAAAFCTWGETDPPEDVDLDVAYADMRAADLALEQAWRPMAVAFAALVIARGRKH
jgi:GMP synthase-like glutamine amidotransferase